MATKIVYANAPYVYAYAWHSFDQKAAKIPENTALTVKRVVEGWYEIEKLPATGGAYAPADKWFVDPVQTHEVLIPVEPPCESSDLDDVLDAGLAFLTLLVKYLKAK